MSGPPDVADANGTGASGGAPVAVRLEVQQAEHDGAQVLQLVESGPMSAHTIRMTPDVAIRIGEMLALHGHRLKSGLILPPKT